MRLLTRFPIMFIQSTFILYIILNIFSCSEKNPTSNQNNLLDIRFPLNVGNKWIYHVTVEQEDSVSITGMKINELEVTCEITEQQRVYNTDSYRIDSVHRVISGPDSGQVETTQEWYAVKEDTLWAVANDGTSPWLTVLHKYSMFENTNEISYWGVNVLVYPLEIGKEWEFSRVGDIGHKKVENFETINVPEGKIKAFKIVRELEWVPTSVSIDIVKGSYFIFNQWFSSIGLAKMTHESYDYSIRDEWGNGKKIFSETMELVSYNIKE